MKAAILVNGTVLPDDETLHAIQSCDLIVCADGAAGWALTAGIKPDVLIGDMDSIDPALLVMVNNEPIEIFRLPEKKDDTDTQAAVDLAMERGADEFLITGALGGRLDHTLGNLMLLIRLVRRGKAAVLSDERQMVLAACSEIILHGKPGRLVSIVPFGDGLFIEKTEGLAYPIHHRSIPCDITLGISNVFTSAEARISITGGTAIIIMQK